MALHEGGRLASAPSPALVLVVPDQLPLLRVHGDDRLAPGQRPADLIIDVLELRVAVGMIRAFLGLPVALEAVVHRTKELRDLLMTDRMVLAGEFRRAASSACSCTSSAGETAGRPAPAAPPGSPALAATGGRSPGARCGPPPARRIRPAAIGCSPSSRIPLVIVPRDNPQTRLIREMPPSPSCTASFAAIIRRLRSSKCCQIRANFRLRARWVLMHPLWHAQDDLLMLFIDARLANVVWRGRRAVGRPLLHARLGA